MEQNDLASRPSALSYLADEEANHVASPPSHPARKRKGHPLLWGLGGTLLSILGFVAMIAFDQYNGMISELRNDLKHFNETYSEFVKKETFHRWTDQIKEARREMQAAALAREKLEVELKASEAARAELARQFQQVRERLAAVEGRQAATPVIVPVTHQEK
jgi:hypothetical protein